MVKNIFPLIIVGIFAVFAGFPLLHKGLLPTHDGEYHIVRFYEFNKTFFDGNLYPRWAPDLNNGYGVPLFNYVYPLPNYVATFLHFFGSSFITAFKLEMFFALILGSAFFYLWTKGFWGRMGGIVGAIFYTYSPYHFLDIYIRGSVGEVWALAFFPAFLWSITLFVKSRRQIFLILSSVFLALIIFSHNILALIFFPFAVSYYGVIVLGVNEDKARLPARQGDWAKWGKGIFVFLLGIGLSAIFWLPALLERQYVTGLQAFNFLDHFPDLYQLIIPSWGSGFSAGTLANQLSFQIGVANLVAVFLSVSIFLVYRKKRGKRLIMVFFILWLVSIFLSMLKVSQPIWQYIPLMKYFQFPWRLLSLEILIASFLAGSIIYFWKSKLLAICLIFLSFILGVGYAKPAYYHYRADNYYLTRSNFIDGTNSPGNAFNTVFLKVIPKKEKEKAIFLRGDGKIEQKFVESTMYVFNIKAESNSEILVNSAYFPGWKVYIGESKVKIKDRNGVISFFLPKGEHIVKVLFENTLVRTIATFISIASFLILIFLFTSKLFGTIRK